MDSFGRVAEILVTALLLFLVPIQYAAYKEELAVRDYVKTEAVELVDAVRNTGALSQQMYGSFLKKLSVTGNVYEISLAHYRRRYQQTEEGVPFFYEGVFHQDIRRRLMEEERYFLDTGDFLRITVQKKNRDLSSIMRGFWGISGDLEPSIVLIYGGAVRDEID